MRSTKSMLAMTEMLESRTLLSATPQVVGYFPDYRFTDTLLQHLNWAGLTQVNYFSIRPNADGTIPANSSDGNDLTASTSELNKLVQAAHAHSVKADIVIGGAGLDDTLQQIIDAGKNTWDTFATNLKTFCTNHGLNGIDLDWEPSAPTSAELSGYGGLIADLRSSTSGLKLSAAVNAEQVDVSGGGKAYVLNTQAIQNLDTINVMAYDLRPASGFSPTAVTEQDLTAWGTYVQGHSGAKSQLMFAMPFYGRSNTDVAELYGTLVQNYINQYGTTPPTSSDTLTIGSSTWYINGPDTIAAKTNFALNNNFGGVAIWELGQDYFTAGGGYDSTHSLFPQVAKTVAAHVTPATASISGKVFNDANGNAKLDTNEAGISGITVYIDANNNSKFDTGERSTTTSSTGTYSFTGLAAGSYKIRAAVPAGSIQTAPASNAAWAVTLAAGQTVTGDNFGQKRTAGAVSGSVKAAGKGVAGVTIYLDANGNGKLDTGEVKTTTLSSGAYSFASVPASTYTIRQVVPAAYNQTMPASNAGLHITLAGGQTIVNENFTDTLKPTASISGMVFNDANGNSAKNTGETGLAGWTVFIDANNDGIQNSTERHTTTDASGNFSFTALAAGTYVVRVVHKSGYTQTSPTRSHGRSITLAAGQKVTGQIFGERKS